MRDGKQAEDAYQLFKRGESLLKSRNPAQAAVVLARARRLEPEKTSIREALGRAYFDSGDFRRAAGEFSFVLERYPTNDYAHYCLGRCAEKLGDAMLSRRHLRLASVLGFRE
ncbi:tetratricopeptide repeat protein [bacterium BMS3Abin01]|nr:tetratricopeptide repeat protein [bacterium BMS3Abin01]